MLHGPPVAPGTCRLLPPGYFWCPPRAAGCLPALPRPRQGRGANHRGKSASKVAGHRAHPVAHSGTECPEPARIGGSNSTGDQLKINHVHRTTEPRCPPALGALSPGSQPPGHRGQRGGGSPMWHVAAGARDCFVCSGQANVSAGHPTRGSCRQCPKRGQGTRRDSSYGADTSRSSLLAHRQHCQQLQAPHVGRALPLCHERWVCSTTSPPGAQLPAPLSAAEFGL